MLETLQKSKTIIKSQKAITLITLVITIILLIILAGVAVNVALGQNGILKRTKEAKLSMQEATVKETIKNIILQMQIDEITKEGNLKLKQVAENLASKDSNITLEEHGEEAKELKGTYNLNGEEYTFIINEKLKVEVTGKAEPKIVSIQNLEWKNGKPQVTVASSQEGTIEYKDSEGNWQPFTNGAKVENNTTLIVRVKLSTGETTKEEKLEIKDKIKPTEFEIELPSKGIQAKAVTVSLKTEPQDNETGLKEGYTYVAETNNNKIEKNNITDTTYKITGLEPETNYTVYVIAYDNAGNYRESNKVKIKTPEYVPPTPSAPNNESTIREGKELPFEWNQLSEISGIIENTLKDSNPNNDITNDTNEFKLNYEGEDYVIGVGDWKYVKYNNENYKVRIMGFNHDILAGQNILNEDGTLKEEYLDTTNSNNQISEEGYNKLNKAGISFEFEECIFRASEGMDSKNVGGWADVRLRKTLNGEEKIEARTEGIIDSLTEINEYVKKVINAYGADCRNSIISYTEDTLWLLSCAEIWGTNSASPKDGCLSGYSKNVEGKQYKFYKNAEPIYSKSNTQLVKKMNTNSSSWWLRSIKGGNSSGFLSVLESGYAFSGNGPYSRGVAPGFSI